MPPIDWWTVHFATKGQWPHWGGTRASRLTYGHQSTDHSRCKIGTVQAVRLFFPTLWTFSLLIYIAQNTGGVWYEYGPCKSSVYSYFILCSFNATSQRRALAY
jgi:hypothetical protein